MMISASLRWLLLCACAWLAACAGLPARGTVGGQTIETRVDSEAARYYLESYLAGRHENRALDARIDHLYRSANGEWPDREALKLLADEFSVDFAALYLADRIVGAPGNRRFRSVFERTRARVRAGFSEGRVPLPAPAADYEVVFVPGYLYRRLPVTGADFAVPRRALERVGLPYVFVETDEDGAVEDNADIVAAAISARAESGRRQILISASKSGPEVALALTKLGPYGSGHVRAWINAVGSLQGTPLADERLLPEIEDRVGAVDTAGMESLTTERSRRRFESFRLPGHVLVINYFGIPLTGSVSALARLGFSHLNRFGPNDGIALLSDLMIPDGVTLAELGLDHYLLGVEIDVTTVALTISVIRWLEGNDETLQNLKNR